MKNKSSDNRGTGGRGSHMNLYIYKGSKTTNDIIELVEIEQVHIQVC